MHIFNVMFGGVPAHPTGLAMSVLRRAQALAKAGHTIELLVDSYSPAFEDDYHSLTSTGTLAGGRIRLRSMHNDLAGNVIPDRADPYDSPLGRSSEGWEYIRDPKRPDIWRGFQYGEYKHFVWMRGDKVNGIDILLQGRRTRRTWYDSAGRLCKVEHMDAQNKPHLIEFINHRGNTYLQETRTAENNKITNIALHGSAGILNFASYRELVQFWFREIVFTDVLYPLIISEYGFHRQALQEIERRNHASVIYTFHNNHRAAPYGRGAPIRAEQRDFFKHLCEYKAVVLLTEEQRIDVEEEMGHQQNLHVIPHHIPIVKPSGVPRDPNRVVMVARFSAIKGHAHVLEAFTKVVAQHPAAKLDLYGRGDEEGNLRAQVESLGLQESVRFRGFTTDAFHEFSSAAVSVVASSYEGFCLSLVESMAAGCVPVSWDFKYGPADLVRDGSDGLIVEAGDIQATSDAILRLIQNPRDRENMSELAKDVSKRLTERKLIDDWENLFRTVHEQAE